MNSGLSRGDPRAETPPSAGLLLAIGFVLCASVPVRMGATRNQGRRLMLGLLDNAKYWRSRAEEARVVAESLEDAQSKQIMLGIARDYERIAELAEQRVKSGGLPAAPWPG